MIGMVVRLEQGCEGEVGEDIAVVDEEGIGREEVGDVVDPAAGLEQDRFVAEGDRDAGVGRIWKGAPVLVGVVVGVDDELAKPRASEVFEGEFDQRPTEHWDQWLRELVGERAQAGA